MLVGTSLFVAVDGGTEVTKPGLPPEGSAFFEKMFGDDAAKEIGIRSDWAKDGIETLGCHQGCSRRALRQTLPASARSAAVY